MLCCVSFWSSDSWHITGTVLEPALYCTHLWTPHLSGSNNVLFLMVTRCPYVYWPQFTLHWKTAYVHILPSKYRAAMEIIQIYAISVGSVFLFLLLISPRSYVKLLITAVSLPTYKHLIYPRVIRRYRYVGPWSRASVLLQLCYILVNTFCISFNVPNVFTAGSRAAHLSLINMVPISPVLT